MSDPAFTAIGSASPEWYVLVLPFALIAGLAIVLPLTLIAASRLLGRFAHGTAERSAAKNQPFESGLPATVGGAAEQFSVKFYLVAMLFLAFDIEVAFLYAWAYQYAHDTSWALFGMLFGFLLLLEVGYLYLWKKRAFDWDE